MVPPYQLVEVPVVPPYHLTKILKLCKTSFYELKVIVLMKVKMFPVSLKAKFECYKNWSKTGGVCGPPLPTGGGACGPPLTNWWGCLWSLLTTECKYSIYVAT